MAIGSAQQEESLAHSARKGKHSTTLTLADTLDLINSALWYYQKAGGKLRLGNSTSQEQTAILALPGTQVCQKCHQIKLFEEMIVSQGAVPDLCQKCTGVGSPNPKGGG